MGADDMQNLEYDGPSRGARLTGLVSSSLVLAALSASFVGVAPPQLGPAIVSTPLVCMATTEFSVVDALITPSDQIRTGRIYFRSDSYPDYYFVELTRIGDHFQAVLPKPNFETQRVIFYFEAVDVSFNITTTPESEAEVVEDADSCRRRDPKAAFYTGQNPSIIVGATSAAAPALPPGFAIEGIAQVISVAGATGGIGAGTLTVAAAGAAVAAGLGVGLLESSATTTTTEPGGPIPPTGGSGSSTTTSTTTTTISVVVVNNPPEACFETRPSPPVIREGEQITLDGRCSTPSGDLAYEWDLGDGRTRSGSFVEPTYTTPGSYNVTLTVNKLSAPSERDSTGRTIRVESAPSPPTPPEPPVPPEPPEPPKPPTADLELAKKASVPSIGPGQSFDYFLTVTNRGPQTATELKLMDCLPQEVSFAECPTTLDCTCSSSSGCNFEVVCTLKALPSGASTQVILRVHGPLEVPKPFSIINNAEVEANESDSNVSNNRASVPVEVIKPPTTTTNIGVSALRAVLMSSLEIEPADGSAKANVLMNRRQLQTMNNANPFRIRIEGRAGRNSIEAYLLSGTRSEGVWRFDFSGDEHFAPGSIEVKRGDVIARDAHRVAFRLAGKSGDRVEFTFLLQP